MTSGTVTCDGGKSTDGREKLLKVSDFLNQFQSHLLPRSDRKIANNDINNDQTVCDVGSRIGTITAEDLGDALEFRYLLEKLGSLQEQKFVVEEAGKNVKSESVTENIIDLKSREIDNVQSEIAKIPDRTKLVFSMLRRCEVWTSKLIAQDQLVTSTELLPPAIRGKTTQSCFCPFLSIPPSSYFEKLLPPIVIDNKEIVHRASTTAGEVTENGPSSAESPTSAFHRKNICIRGATLGLPPNKHTWEAYARLAIMASLIRDDGTSSTGSDEKQSKNQKDFSMRQCLKSPTCVHDLTKRKGKNPSHNQSYSFTPKSDLAPLWMRAQRNTRALRHLILLFEVKRNMRRKENGAIDQVVRTQTTSPMSSEESNGELGNQVDHLSDNCDGDALRFKAKFEGNPFYVQERVIELSEDVDRLVEWAVINQSIFTYRYMRKEILTAPLLKEQKTGRKRQRVTDDQQLFISKKIFRGVNEKENLFELQQACHSYLLKWFARRNRNATTILFSKRIENLHLDIGCSVNMKVLNGMELLKQTEIPAKVRYHMQNLNVGAFYEEDRTFSRIDRRLFIADRYSGPSRITCRSQVSTMLRCLSKACPETSILRKKMINAAIEDWEHLFDTYYPATIDERSQDDVHEAALKLVKPSGGCTESSIIDLLKSAPAPWVEKCYQCKRSGSSDLRVCFNCEKPFHEKCSVTGSIGSKTSSLKDMVLSFPPLHDLFKLKQPTDLEHPDFSKSDNLWAKHTVRIQREIEENGEVRKLGVSLLHTEDSSKLLKATQSDAFTFLERTEEDVRSKKVLIPANISRKGCIITDVHKDLCGGKAGLQVGDVIIGLEVVKYAHAEDEEKNRGSRMIDFSELSRDDLIAHMKVPSLELNLVILRPPINIVDTAASWYNGIKDINRCTLDVLRGMATFQQWYCGGCIRSTTSGEPNSVFLKATYCRAVIRRIGMESYSEPFREEVESSQSDYFSLRRLDMIMTHIMGVQSNNAHHVLAPEAFFAPSGVNSILTRLPWATADLEHRPMDLLCKAMKALVDSRLSGNNHIDSQRSALIRHFILTFTPWCVGSNVISKLHCTLIGPPKIFQYAHAPWFPRRNNTHSILPDLSSSPRNFQQEADSIARKQAEQTGKSLTDYSTNASLVGKTFLVLPDDPLVEYVSKIVRIEHENRPVEFLVASYLPPEYHNEVTNGRQRDQYDKIDEKSGIYHLLPIVSSQQQNFLLDRCKIRNKNVGNSYGSSWTSLDVLNLDGVARYSAKFLHKKMKESSEIRLAIEHTIIDELSPRSTPPPTFFEHQSTGSNTEAIGISSSPVRVALELQDKILDTLLEGEVALGALRQMLDGGECHHHRGSVMGNEDRRNWKIVPRGENLDSLEFGSSYLHVGLVPMNPWKTSWKLLRPENISENQYLLYYSDFLFRDEASKQDLKMKLNPPHILPFRGSQKKSLRMCTMSSSDLFFGWGFEILKWKNENFLRIGRIQHDSPAHRAGLMTHDRIEAINGVRFSRFRNISSMICAILGASKLNIRIPANLNRIDEILAVLSTIKSAKISPSPITLYLFRPSYIDSQKVCRSGMSSNRSAHALQHATRVGTELHPPERSIPPNGGSGRNRPIQASRPGPTAIALQRQNINPEGQRKVSQLKITIQLAYNDRKPVAAYDFYRPAKNGTVLTVLELAIFLEALMKNHLKLGVRLLMPRYDIETIYAQIRKLFSWKTESFIDIPLVKGRIYDHILNVDYERVKCQDYPEVGPIILRETGETGDLFEYRAPVRALPIDRVIEKFWDAEKLRQRQRQQLHQHMLQQQQHYQQHVLHHQHRGSFAQQFSPAQPSQSPQQSPPQQNPNMRQNFSQNTHHTHNNRQSPQEYGNSGRPVSQEATGNTGSHDRHGASSTTNSQQPQRNEDSQNNSNAVEIVDLFDEESEGCEEPPLHSDEPSLNMALDALLNHDTERIRGGGSSTNEPDDLAPDTQSNYSYLCDVPKDQWNGVAVYTFVQTASKGSVCDDALLVGIVKGRIEAHSSDTEIPDKVEIETYYLSGTGYFEKVKVHQTDSDDVWVVNIEEDSEEARVIAKLRSQDRLPSSYQEELQKMVLRTSSSGNSEDHKEQQAATTLVEQQDEQVGDQPATAATTRDQVATTKESHASKICCADALRLPDDQLPNNYTCEEQALTKKAFAENDIGSHDCSLCSLPFERYLVCNWTHEHTKDAPKQTLFRSLGHSLMSDTILTDQASSLDGSLPGRLGEAKSMLLQIARLIPVSLKIPANDVHQRWGGPLQSFRIFDNDDNYAIWQDFVTECVCTDMLAQGLVGLLASIQRSKLPHWWSRKDSGWSTPYALLAGSSLSTLYLHIYVLDAALSDVLSRSLKDVSTPGKKSAEINALQNLRMNEYWQRAIAQGYKAFKGDHYNRCYHCDDGGQLLCCDLCPNVQHGECCNPPLTADAKLDHWLCDSCISDIDSYEDDIDYEQDALEDDKDDEDFVLST